jgi:hypothetical protein
VILAALLFAACSKAETVIKRNTSVPLPFRALDNHFERYQDGGWVSFFVKGVNMGVGVPGSQPGQLAVTRDQYTRWLEMIGDAGFNVLRIYTLHQPRFYEALYRYNSTHDRPIYLMQGIWLDEDNPSGDFYDMSAGYDQEIQYVVDAIHGNATIPLRYGKAYGEFTTDVSPWVLSFVTGREVQPAEVRSTNAAHPQEVAMRGKHVSLANGTPLECWISNRIDNVIDHEWTQYGVHRPVSYSSWPTLDPLTHPIEGDIDEDGEHVDLSNLSLDDAPGGFFIIYHAYPYYPDFVVEDPIYQEATDAWGRNSYYGYLRDLARYYGKVPVVVGEFGVPTSWANAHFGQSGMNHGGNDEAWAGFDYTRMLHDIRDSGCAGSVAFAWMDEWWKRTWITDELDFPRNRRFLWHNVTAAENNFGMLAFELPAVTFDRFTPVTGGVHVRKIEEDVDAEFFHARITLDPPVSASRPLVIGIDTYRDDLGESVLPNGVRTEKRRSEFALVVEAPKEAQVYVTQAYDTYGIWHGSSADYQLYHSIPTDGAPWVAEKWKNNLAHTVRAYGQVFTFPETATDIGRLRVRTATEAASNLDGVVIDGAVLDIRIPWTVILFTDPSRLRVLDDDRATPGRETATSEGIGLSVAYEGELIEAERFLWDGWEDAPPTVEREKASFPIYRQAILEMPEALAQ